MSIDLKTIRESIYTGIRWGERLTDAESAEAISALDRIIAEVERLRGEIDLLQQEAHIRLNLCNNLFVELDTERAEVVAYLCKVAEECTVTNYYSCGESDMILFHAEKIERGEHRREYIKKERP